MSFVGDEGREIYLTFQWNTVQVGSGENRHDIRERDILERVAEKFKAHLEAKKNSIEDANCKGKRLIPSSITTNKFIRNAIACKSLDERVRQRCLEKSKNLTLETTVSIGRMFEATG